MSKNNNINKDIIIQLANTCLELDDSYNEKILKFIKKTNNLIPEPYKTALLISTGTIIKYNKSLDLSHTNIRKLGNLERIEGYLDISHTPISNLGKLKHIGQNLYITNTPNLISLGNLKYIGGTLDLQIQENTSLKDLGTLEYIGGFADFRNSSITSLGNLKYVKDWINISNTNIKGLGKLDCFNNRQLKSDYKGAENIFKKHVQLIKNHLPT